MCQGSFKGVSRKCQGCFKGNLSVFQGSFKVMLQKRPQGVSRKFQRGFKEIFKAFKYFKAVFNI